MPEEQLEPIEHPGAEAPPSDVADVELEREHDARAIEELDAEAPPSDIADVEVEREHDAPAIEELDAETLARRDAALSHVRKFGDPVLRASAVPVERFDAALKTEIERMGELMHDALGVGLAATQLGVLHRVLVYRADPDDPVTALVNPVLEWASEETVVGEEGCLSLPGVHVEVERASQVRVRAKQETGEEREVEAEGLAARIIQHEMDHLDGILILDRISREARKEAMRAMREAAEGKRHPDEDTRADSSDGEQPDEDRPPADEQPERSSADVAAA
jgi:peptide deformylase